MKWMILMIKVIPFAALTLLADGSSVARQPPSIHSRSVLRLPKLEVNKSAPTRQYYPAYARSHGWQGVTMVDICLDAKGVATGVLVTHSSGHDFLDRAALVWITNGAVFSPATRNGKPIPMCVKMPVTFALRP